MSLKYLVENYLREDSRFRERTNKDRGIVNLLINRYGLHHAIERGEITKDRIIALVQDYASMDRYWRQCLEKNSELRGSDYEDKDVFEFKKLVELGYHAPQAIGQAEAVEKEKQPTLL